MAEHWTPGPWMRDPDNDGLVWTDSRAVASVTDGGVICHLTRGGTQERLEANARLIAAAPELYDALLAMLFGYTEDDVRKRAYAALAKARGESA